MAELVVRVQWAKGFTDVSDGGSGRRRTIPYNAGADCQTEDQAEAIGAAALDVLGPQTSVEARIGDSSIWPELGNAYDVVGFDGSVATQRLMGRRVSTNRNGDAVLAPTFGSLSQTLAERQAQAIRRIAAGGNAGRTAGVSPSTTINSGVPSGTLRSVSLPEWSLDGIEEREGPVWPVEEAVVATKAHILVTAALPDDDMSVFINVGGALAAAITLPQGDTEISVLGALLIEPGEKLQVAVDSIGSNDAGDLTDHKLTVKFTAAPAQLRVET